MKDRIDIDEQIGGLLRRDLPVPEHREGYRERLETVIRAEAEERARATLSASDATLGDRFEAWAIKKRWMSWLRLSREDRVETLTVSRPRATQWKRTRGLRIAVFACIAVLLVAAVAVGLSKAVEHLGKDGFTLVITDQTTVTSGPGRTTTTIEGTLEASVYSGIPYMNRAEGLLPAQVNVYAPKQAGPWPVVVMLHEGGMDIMSMSSWAAKAAQRGAVVFVPEWGRSDLGFLDFTPEQLRAMLVGQIGDAAAAVRYARATAARYGGDPQNLILSAMEGAP